MKRQATAAGVLAAVWAVGLLVGFAKQGSGGDGRPGGPPDGGDAVGFMAGAAFPTNSGTGGAPSPLAGTTNPATGSPWAIGDTYHLAFVSSTTTNMTNRFDIHYWNDYVNTVAAGSSLPGIPDLTWKVIGSDRSHHARDNALVTAPVFLVDAATKIADGYDYMWNGSIDAALNMDESGNPEPVGGSGRNKGQ